MPKNETRRFDAFLDDLPQGPIGIIGHLYNECGLAKNEQRDTRMEAASELSETNKWTEENPLHLFGHNPRFSPWVLLVST